MTDQYDKPASLILLILLCRPVVRGDNNQEKMTKVKISYDDSLHIHRVADFRRIIVR